MACAGYPSCVPFVVLADVDQLNRSVALQLGDALGSTSIARTVPSPAVEWVNWSGSQRVTPAAFERPRTRAELAELVVRGPGPVRVAGAGHSFSAAAVTDGTLLSLDALARVLDADASSGLVRVEAGIRLRALSRELHARGLAMPNLGDIDAQSLAGALSTGTHGTGTRLPNLSGQVVSVELVLADGSERTLDEGDLLRAARVSLGALGVIVAVTLRCVPRFRLHNTDRPEPLEDVLAELQERADAHDHFEFWTFPHSDLALTRTHDRTDAAPRPPGRPGPTSTTSCSTTTPSARSTRSPAASAHDPAPEPLRLRGASSASGSTGPTRSSPRSARALRGDGVRVPREHAVAAVRARPRRARAPPRLLPDRAALHRRRRRVALARARPRQRVRGRARPSRHGLRAGIPRRRGGAVGASAGARTGASARSSPPPSSPRATRAGTPSRPCAPELDPGGRFTSAWVRDVLG